MWIDEQVYFSVRCSYLDIPLILKTNLLGNIQWHILGLGPPLFWSQKKKLRIAEEEKPTGQATKNWPPSQGLDLPLIYISWKEEWFTRSRGGQTLLKYQSYLNVPAAAPQQVLQDNLSYFLVLVIPAENNCRDKLQPTKN